MATRRRRSAWGVHRTYTETNLRYSQMAPLSMFEEVNTGNNLPVQFDIMAAPGEHHADEFHLMFVAKGGGRRTSRSCSRKRARSCRRRGC